jgi:hypothetical protein
MSRGTPMNILYDVDFDVDSFLTEMERRGPLRDGAERDSEDRDDVVLH